MNISRLNELKSWFEKFANNLNTNSHGKTKEK